MKRDQVVHLVLHTRAVVSLLQKREEFRKSDESTKTNQYKLALIRANEMEFGSRMPA